MDITVRRAQSHDIPDILVMNELMNGVGCTAEWMKESLETNQSEIVFVAIHNDKAIGLICGQLNPSICYAYGVECEVKELFVCEDYRQKGVATKLIQRLELEFEKYDATEITLQTGKRNVIAQKFYENSGYEVMQRIVYRKKQMDYVIIEQTKEYAKRMKYDPETKTFFETEYDSLAFHRDFTHPYGWLKGSGTPPEDHLDVILLSHENCSLGDELPVKIVGVFKRNDGDHKLIGISPQRAEADFPQLPEHEKDDLHRLYPRVGDGEGWFGKETAREVIADFMKNKRAK